MMRTSEKVSQAKDRDGKEFILLKGFVHDCLTLFFVLCS